MGQKQDSRPQAQPKNKHFWTFRAAAEENDAPELILYGDIASETWWGDEVTPRQFTEELDALGAVPEIVVRINSGGGDVFAANAIYTRLKDNAAKITVKIDGWAASAATIVAMAGDVIEIPGNGVFMVHDPSMGLLGYFNEADLVKLTDEIKVIKQSIVNGYALKTGKPADEIASIMAAETWYDGKQAVEAGFCDKLMFEDAETTVENGAKIVVNSVSLDLNRYPNMTISLLNRLTARTPGGFSNTITQNTPKRRDAHMEHRSFEQIYLQYYKPVYAYLMTLCQNEELAAELTQETFYKALDAIDGFKGGCALNVWLCQIAKNTLTDTYRRQKRELPPLDDTLTDVPSPAPLPGEELEQREGALSLYQKLHALPEPYREVFWLRVYGELTFAEIAALHHKTESWARVTFYRARMKMKEAIL